MIQQITIRQIQQHDNAAIAAVIRNTLLEFGAARPGTVYYDNTTDHLFELFQQPSSCYFVAEAEGKVVGGGGIYPTTGLPEGICELVKMYLLQQVRGRGYARLIIDKCLQQAKAFGFTKVYLETMPELEQAMKVYEKFGFTYLNGPLGQSGHFGCSKWMLLNLSE